MEHFGQEILVAKTQNYNNIKYKHKINAKVFGGFIFNYCLFMMAFASVINVMSIIDVWKWVK